MGLFLRITYQSQGGRTPETAFKAGWTFGVMKSL